jgi:hypothetical protein
MSKKHFERLADSLAMVRPTEREGREYYQWVSSVNAVADVCQWANSAFDRSRFVRACQERY